MSTAEIRRAQRMRRACYRRAREAARAASYASRSGSPASVGDALVNWTVKLVCPICAHVVAKQRGVTEAERARAEGPRPVLVCGSRRCGAGVRTMDVVWIREEETHV